MYIDGIFFDIERDVFGRRGAVVCFLVEPAGCWIFCTHLHAFARAKQAVLGQRET